MRSRLSRQFGDYLRLARHPGWSPGMQAGQLQKKRLYSSSAMTRSVRATVSSSTLLCSSLPISLVSSSPSLSLTRGTAAKSPIANRQSHFPPHLYLTQSVGTFAGYTLLDTAANRTLLPNQPHPNQLVLCSCSVLHTAVNRQFASNLHLYRPDTSVSRSVLVSFTFS